MLAGKLEDFVQDRPGDLPLCEADVVLVEYPPFSDKSVPKDTCSGNRYESHSQGE